MNNVDMSVISIRPLIKNIISKADPQKKARLLITMENQHGAKERYSKIIYPSISPSENADSSLREMADSFPGWDIIDLGIKSVD